MRARALLALCALVGLPTGPAVAAPDETPLFQNGGFEKGVAGWRVLDMSGESAFEPDDKVVKEGKKSLRIEKRGTGKPDWLKQSATLPAGVKEVHAVCWFKVDKGARAEVTVYFFDGSDDTIGKGDVALVGSGPNKKWEKAEERLKVPDGAVGVGVNVKVTAKGTLWIDGLDVLAAGLGAVGLLNGGFEQGLDGWKPLEFGSGTTVLEADRAVKADGKASLKMTRSSPRILVEDGASTDVSMAGEAGRRRLDFRARLEGAARASVVLQAFDDRGVATSTSRAPAASEPGKFGEGTVRMDVPAGTRRLVVSLIVVGTGSAWFDALVLSSEK